MGKVRHKFFAKPCKHDGIKFPSKLEGRYYLQLKQRQEAGEVLFFLRQVPLHLPGNKKYVVDFVEFLTDGNVRFVDVKGIELETFRIKKSVVEATYPIEIEVVSEVK